MSVPCPTFICLLVLELVVFRVDVELSLITLLLNVIPTELLEESEYPACMLADAEVPTNAADIS